MSKPVPGIVERQPCLGLTDLQTKVLRHYAHFRWPINFGGELAGWGTSVRELQRRRMVLVRGDGISLTDKGRAALKETDNANA